MSKRAHDTFSARTQHENDKNKSRLNKYDGGTSRHTSAIVRENGKKIEGMMQLLRGVEQRR